MDGQKGDQKGDQRVEPALHVLSQKLTRFLGLDLERGGRRRALERFALARVAELGLPLSAYVEALGSDANPELQRLAEAVTVGHTWFFRDPGQIELVRRLIAEPGPRDRPLCLWVPGCATGEDVYTLAMLADAEGRAAHVLGSDVNQERLALARAGCYPRRVTRDVPEAMRRYLLPRGDGTLEVAPALRRRVRFLLHNLLSPPPPSPMGRGFDLILCRNVLIYFRAEESLRTVARLGQALLPGGALVLGASEVLHAVPQGLRRKNHGGRSVLVRDPGHAPASAPARVPAQAAEKEKDPAQAAIEALLDAGDSALQGGRTDEALERYAALLLREPAHAEAHLLCGLAYHLRGEWAAGAAALERCLALWPGTWPAAFYLALCLDRLGQRAEAERAYRIALDAGQGPLQVRSAVLRSIVACQADIRAACRGRLSRNQSP